MNDYYGDSAYTYTVGDVKPEIKRLLQITKESLYKGIEKAVEGNRLGDISFAVQNYCETNGYSVVREMGGHGVGVRTSYSIHYTKVYDLNMISVAIPSIPSGDV